MILHEDFDTDYDLKIAGHRMLCLAVYSSSWAKLHHSKAVGPFLVHLTTLHHIKNCLNEIVKVVFLKP
jgi:hypothetical protein